MSLCKWTCDHEGCKSVAVGSGGAIGLRAIGWHFVRGGSVKCPAHRPDPMPCKDNDTNAGKPCSTCRGEAEADHWQELIESVVALAKDGAS